MQLIEQVHVVLDTVYNGLEDVDHQEQYGARIYDTVYIILGLTNCRTGRMKTDAESKMLDIEIYERRVRGAVRVIELMCANKYSFEVELPLRRVFNLMLRVFSIDGSVLVYTLFSIFGSGIFVNDNYVFRLLAVTISSHNLTLLVLFRASIKLVSNLSTLVSSSTFVCMV